MLCDVSIPILPALDLQDTIEFYVRLGFQNDTDPAHREYYAILRRGEIELHFFPMPELIPAESYAGCYLRVSNVNELFQEFAAQSLPKSGIPRLGCLENKSWGMREFAIVDSSGNLLRIGQIIHE
ncbi:MAG: VOC family protein [Leptolyngbyaceae cyanobacterium RU_5_1]|nr:VOC family protein [Leptolyngbyaceae cyanobacterium RU_5_1]